MYSTVLLNVAMLSKVSALYDNSDLIVTIVTPLIPNVLEIYELFQNHKFANKDKKLRFKNENIKTTVCTITRKIIKKISIKMSWITFEYEKIKECVHNQERSQNENTTIMEKQQEKSSPADAKEQ